MSRLMVIENITLDGVMQGRGHLDEDPRDGFAHGGWARPYPDEVMMRFMSRGMAAEGVMLFGRRTYEHFFDVWAGQTDGNPFTEGEALLTDGPFAEGKEHLGGFTIVKVPDLDAALAWDAKVARATRLPIEVRPIQ